MTASSFASWLVSPTSAIPSPGATVIMSSLYQAKNITRTENGKLSNMIILQECGHGCYPAWGVSSDERSSTEPGKVTITTSLISASEGTTRGRNRQTGPVTAGNHIE